VSEALLDSSVERIVLRLPKLYPKQHAAVFDLHRYSVIEATTKAGKTVGCLVWILYSAWTRGKDGRNWWWVAPVYSQSQVAFSRMHRMLRRADPSMLTWQKHGTESWIQLASGARIWFKSGDKPDSLYGEDVHGAVIDEASRCKEATWHAIRSTVTQTRGDIRIIGNVRGRRNWAYRIARVAESGSDVMGYHKITAVDAVEAGILAKDEIEDAEKILPRDVFRQLYLAEPTDDGGNPFGMSAIAECAQEGLSGDEPVAFGVDLAKYQNWTVIIGLDKNGRIAKIDRFQADWQQTKNRILSAVGDVPTYVDSTGVGDPIVEELHRQKGNIVGFNFTPKSKQQLMEGLASAVQRTEVGVLDGWLRNEMEVFEFEYRAGGQIRYSAPEGTHDDGVCALAMAHRMRESGLTGMNLDVRVVDMPTVGGERSALAELFRDEDLWA
jgi:hypothetical protein